MINGDNNFNLIFDNKEKYFTTYQYSETLWRPGKTLWD